jgi:hypothetical protein
MKGDYGCLKQSPVNFVSCSTSAKSYACSNSFYQLQNDQCSNVDKKLRFESFIGTTANFLHTPETTVIDADIYGPSISSEITLTIGLGYNFFDHSDLGGYRQLTAGEFLVLEMSDVHGLVDFQLSSNEIEDFRISPTSSRLNSTYKLAFQLNTVLSPRRLFKTYKNYTSLGQYTISLDVINTKFPSISQQLTRQVMIEEPVTNLVAFIPIYGTCYFNVSCSISSKISTGTNLNYIWDIKRKIDDSTVFSFNILLSFTKVVFPEVGEMVIYLTAANHVSNTTYVLNITVSEFIPPVSDPGAYMLPDFFDMFYIVTNPENVAPGEFIFIEAYWTLTNQSYNLAYKYFVDGVLIESAPKMCNNLLFFIYLLF